MIFEKCSTPVKVETRQGKYSFHFVTDEPYKTIQQLADLAARNVMDGDQAPWGQLS